MELKQDKLFSMTQSEIAVDDISSREYFSREPELLAQASNVEILFGAWQKLMKVYRAGGILPNDDNQLTDGSESE